MYERFTKTLGADISQIRQLSKQRQDPACVDHMLTTAETVLRGKLRADAEHLGTELEGIDSTLGTVEQLLHQGNVADAQLELKNVSRKVANLIGFLV